MTTFLDALIAETNKTHTDNGAVAHKSSLDPVVDFFSLAGAMRGRPEAAADLFERAFAVEPLTAVRTLFYLRDIRGGQGEREIFRAGLKRLDALTSGIGADKWLNILSHVPEYGRWDDLLALGADNVFVHNVIRGQLHDDLSALAEGEQVSLMAKWLPSENASSAVTKARGKALRMALELTPRNYRKTLSKLRARIRLLEQDMSANRWDQIEYGKLPSQAHRKHVKAFQRHTPERYAAYLDAVTKGEEKINVSTVFPYEIFEMVGTYNTYTYQYEFANNAYANTAWENLPDYTDGKNALVMADVSGSMNGRPMAVSVSLALYFAERNTGAFKGNFLTFSSSPALVRVNGLTLAERMRNISRADWHQSTDLLKAFRAILAAALQARESVPEVLYIISDMQFDQATRGRDQETIFATAKREFAAAGLTLPHVVFWNVNARDNQPATILDHAVTLVSGSSPNVFGMAVQNKTPRQLVDSVVNGPRYERIVL